MINFDALSKISYGLYIVCSGDKNRRNGYISNTVFQVTSEPARFATCCSKNNFTCEIINELGVFSVSVLHQNTSSDIYSTFGYKSGANFDKFEGSNVQYGKTGVPIVLNDCLAFLECKVIQIVDVGSHWLFVGELVDAQVLDEVNEPITYAYYRHTKKGIAPKNAPTYIDKSKIKTQVMEKSEIKYECAVCGHIHDDGKEKVKFSDLPDSWICPVCGADKEDFFEV